MTAYMYGSYIISETVKIIFYINLIANKGSGFQLSVVKPKPKQLLWPITSDTDNLVNQMNQNSQQIHVASTKCKEACAKEL